MRPALCLAGTALAVGLSGCSADGPTITQAATTPTPTPSAAVVTPAPTTTAPAPATTPSAPAPEASTPTVPPALTSAPVATTEEPDDPLSPRPGIESAPAPGQPTCRAGALTVTDADAVYTTSAVQELFTIRTTGPDCQLKGYPTVALLDEAGRKLPAAVSRGGYGLAAGRPRVVTLSAGSSVSFFVATARDGACEQATTLVTTLPGTSTALRASTPMQVCDAAVGLTPVRRLTDDE